MPDGARMIDAGLLKFPSRGACGGTADESRETGSVWLDCELPTVPREAPPHLGSMISSRAFFAIGGWRLGSLCLVYSRRNPGLEHRLASHQHPSTKTWEYTRLVFYLVILILSIIPFLPMAPLPPFSSLWRGPRDYFSRFHNLSLAISLSLVASGVARGVFGVLMSHPTERY